jgi:integrase
MKSYSSLFAKHIRGFIEHKRSLGYQYITEEIYLHLFDTLCLKYYPYNSILTMDIAFFWAKSRIGEHPGTLQGRVSILREFAKYLTRLGIEAYIFPKNLLPKVPQYKPYIYSNEELKHIFEQTDKCHYCVLVPKRQYVMPVLFRLLYCTAMRISEARFLKVKDVDLCTGIITVLNAKFDKHRQIPLSLEMLERLKIYSQNVHLLSAPDDWYFPGTAGKPLTLANIDHNFRRFLWKAGISHGGRGKGPRIHDFRHTSAVHCLRRWVMEEKDLRAYLPILQAYLGHYSLADTAYYLHLTAELFPNILKQVESSIGDIIPKIGARNENE